MSKEPIPKIKKLGPGMWVALHALAEEYFSEPKPYEKSVKAIFRKIPCARCSHDAFDYLSKYPIQNPIEWICKFHNHVNRKIGKPCRRCPDFPLHTSDKKIVFKPGQV